jgi:hypothetical protein
MAQGALPGFRDFYPELFAERAYITGVWRDVARRFAFVEWDGPVLEPLELYTKKSGDEIVGQLYNFTDKGGREVALRPEMTPTLARMVAAHERNYKKPIKWFAMPQLFRYERQQKGRLREHFQFNADIIGESDPAADAEIIALVGFIHMMRVAVDPASRGAQYSGMAMQAFGKATSLNPENPRALVLMAQMQFGTAKFFGSPATEACATLNAAIQKFDSYKSDNPLAPQWGREMALGLKKECN